MSYVTACPVVSDYCGSKLCVVFAFFVNVDGNSLRECWIFGKIVKLHFCMLVKAVIVRVHYKLALVSYIVTQSMKKPHDQFETVTVLCTAICRPPISIVTNGPHAGRCRSLFCRFLVLAFCFVLIVCDCIEAVCTIVFPVICSEN